MPDLAAKRRRRSGGQGRAVRPRRRQPRRGDLDRSEDGAIRGSPEAFGARPRNVAEGITRVEVAEQRRAAVRPAARVSRCFGRADSPHLQAACSFGRLASSDDLCAGPRARHEGAESCMRLSTNLSPIRGLIVVVMLVSLPACASTASSSSTGSGTSTMAASSTLAATPSSSTATPTPASRFAVLGPLQTVQRYWRAVATQNYAAAYRDLARGSVPQDAASFISQEQRANIQNVSFRGTLLSVVGASATVTVNSLQTTDGQFGCRTWSGTYQLSRQNGRWLIEHASITPAPCQASPPPPPPSAPPSTTTNPGNSSNGTTVEGPGSTSHATDAQFCTTHTCIPNFPNGNGTIVQCVDSEWSHSGGLSGACSDHGGES
jgi:hypothetical protein